MSSQKMSTSPNTNSPEMTLSPPSPPSLLSFRLPPSPPFSPQPLKIVRNFNYYSEETAPPKIGILDLCLNKKDVLLDPVWNEELKIVPPAVLRRMILNPREVPLEWLDARILNSVGELRPLHLPSTADLIAFPVLIRILFFWGMDFLENRGSNLVIPPMLESILDPPVILPAERELLTLNLSSIRVEAMSWTNCVKLVKTRMWEKQIVLEVKWWLEEVVVNANRTSLSLEPKTSNFCLPERLKKGRVMLEEVGEVGAHCPLPPVHPDMHLIYWNARGIARANFLSNMKMLIQQHAPKIVVVSETKVSKLNTPEIVSKLPFDKHFLVEPVGLSGGILVLWHSEDVYFEPIKVNRQGVHGIIQGSFGADDWGEA